MVSPKRKIYITVAIAVVVSLFLAVFGIAPFAGKVKESSQEFAKQKALLGLLEINIGEVKGFQDGHSALKQNLNRIESAFVETDSPVVFLDSLEETANLSGLPMRVRPFPSKLDSDDPWFSVGFQVNLGGRVQDCLRFLEMLEQSKWMFEIIQFNLEKISDENPYFKEFEDLKPGDAYMSLILKAYSGRVPLPEERPKAQ